MGLLWPDNRSFTKTIIVVCLTVGTPNKGLLILCKMGQIRENLRIPLFGVFTKSNKGTVNDYRVTTVTKAHLKIQRWDYTRIDRTIVDKL